MSHDYLFLKTCRLQETEYTPVWMMRQAGRYMKEYRLLREKYPFLTMCKTPELVVEVTLQPIERLNVDAAILFADILLPIEPMGVGLEFKESKGPVIDKPIRSPQDVEDLKSVNPEEDLPFVYNSIKILRKELEGKVPLIGFSGAPFTIASYLIEGGGSKNYINTKKMMYVEPALFHELMSKIARVLADYSVAQVKSGAQVFQLFDSWVGCLSPGDYKEFVLPYSKLVLDELKETGVPVIHFGTNSSTLLKLMREAGGDIIGVDWRINLDDAWKIIGFDKGIQGNLDPYVILGSDEYIKDKVRDILERAAGRPGHIFNFGHGIFPQASVEKAAFMIDAVHELSQR